jgi:FtsH-binding integral membrane protein
MDKNHLEMGLDNGDFSNENDFSSIQKHIRLNFIRKVLGILASQLSLTVIFCIFSMSSKAFLEFQLNNIALFYLCFISSIIILIVLYCFPDLARKVPNNYIMLFGFTICESYTISFVCGISNPQTVLMAALMTFSMVVALGLYAVYTKTDFSMQGGAIFVFGCAFLMLSIFGMFTTNKFFHIFLSVLGIILFGFYLIYDIQLIVGNKTVMLETDDYIIASLMLYTDIVSIFIEILSLLTHSNN